MVSQQTYMECVRQYGELLAVSKDAIHTAQSMGEKHGMILWLAVCAVAVALVFGLGAGAMITMWWYRIPFRRPQINSGESVQRTT